MTGTVKCRTARLRAIETNDDLARGVRALRRNCAIMRKVHDATGLPPLRLSQPGFAGLARIIIGQQLSVASAAAIWTRCEATISPMAAETIARLDDETLKAAGLSRPKIRTLRALAGAVVDEGLDLEAMADRSDGEIREALLGVSGIGPWTASLFLMFCLGRPDAFAPGDLALQVAAQEAFGLDERPTADHLLTLSEPWRPWRGVAARLLWSYYGIIKRSKSGVPV
ncbi:MAG: DNA-3-methyladenine glycosylase 2 family protein [Pseudomonadota bacterium]